MKTYYIIYKKANIPGTVFYKLEAEHKGDAKLKFKESGIKYDYIIRVIT
jgi:hypothetical protein